MKIRELGEIAAALGGQLRNVGLRPRVRGATMDTRHLKPGDLFFALPGRMCRGALPAPKPDGIDRMLI